MKNFSELTAINIDQSLEVDIKLVIHDANYTFKINGLDIVDTHYHTKLGLFDDIILECNVLAGAVELDKFTINNFEALPKYQHLATPPTAWITNNWTFKIPAPFYVWKHQTTGQGLIF